MGGVKEWKAGGVVVQEGSETTERTISDLPCKCWPTHLALISGWQALAEFLRRQQLLNSRLLQWP
jgi:hypothetical protein